MFMKKNMYMKIYKIAWKIKGSFGINQIKSTKEKSKVSMRWQIPEGKKISYFLFQEKKVAKSHGKHWYKKKTVVIGVIFWVKNHITLM